MNEGPKSLNDFLNDQGSKNDTFVQVERCLERFAKIRGKPMTNNVKRMNDFSERTPPQGASVRSRSDIKGSPWEKPSIEELMALHPLNRRARLKHYGLEPSDYGMTAREMGINPRALGENPRAQRRGRRI